MLNAFQPTTATKITTAHNIRGPLERALARRGQLDHLARQGVCVDDDGTQLGQHRRDGALARRDTPRETHSHGRHATSWPEDFAHRTRVAPSRAGAVLGRSGFDRLRTAR